MRAGADMGADTGGHEQTENGLAIQRAILSLMRAQGTGETTALAEEPDWQSVARPEPAVKDASEGPETIINLLCAIQQSEIGERLRSEGRGVNRQAQSSAFDKRTLPNSLPGGESVSQRDIEAKPGNEQSQRADFDPRSLMEAIQGTETAALLERQMTGSNGHAPALAFEEPANGVAAVSEEPLVPEEPAEVLQRQVAVLEPICAPTPAEPQSVREPDADSLTGNVSLSAAVVDDSTFADASAETAEDTPSFEDSEETPPPDASREIERVRITRRSSVRARRRRISKPLRILEIPASPAPAASSQPGTSIESPPELVPVCLPSPSVDHSSIAASSVEAPVDDRSAAVLVPPPEPCEDHSQITPADAAAPGQKDKAQLGADQAEENSPRAPDQTHVNGNGSPLASARDSSLNELVLPSLATKVGGKLTGELNPLAWTAGVTSQCLNRAEMQLESWFLKWFEPPDPRHSTRVDKPPLVAYHWIVDSPQALKIANISSGGLYLVTEDRWSEGNIISMTLQRTDREKGSPESWIAVDFVVMRWCRDGVAGAFLPHTPGLSDAVAGRAKNCADRKTLERFVKELTSR